MQACLKVSESHEMDQNQEKANKQTNKQEKTKLYFCKRDVLLLIKSCRTCIYGSKDHSSISQTSY